MNQRIDFSKLEKFGKYYSVAGLKLEPMIIHQLVFLNELEKHKISYTGANVKLLGLENRRLVTPVITENDFYYKMSPKAKEIVKIVNAL